MGSPGLAHLFISPWLLLPTHAARAWLRGNVCNRQHTLGITSTPFRAFRPSSCCCMSLCLYRLGWIGLIFFLFVFLKVWWPLSLGNLTMWRAEEKDNALEEFILLLPLSWPCPSPEQRRGEKNQQQSLQAAKKPLKIFVFSHAGLRLVC